MLRHLLAGWLVLLFVPLAAYAEGIQAFDVDTAAEVNVRQDVDESVKPAANEIAEGRAVERLLPPEPARWAVRAEAWGTAYRWSLTNGSLFFDMTVDQRRPSSMLATDKQWDSGLRQTSNRRQALFQGPSRPNIRNSFIDKLGVGWTPAPSSDLLPFRAWDMRLGESDRMILRLRRSVLSVFAQRTF
jgi:hypothetical protein